MNVTTTQSKMLAAPASSGETFLPSNSLMFVLHGVSMPWKVVLGLSVVRDNISEGANMLVADFNENEIHGT